MSVTVQPAHGAANAARHEHAKWEGGAGGAKSARVLLSIRLASRTAQCGGAEGAHHHTLEVAMKQSRGPPRGQSGTKKESTEAFS